MFFMCIFWVVHCLQTAGDFLQMACFTILILNLLHKFGNLFSVFMDDNNVFLGMCQIEIMQTFSLVDSVRRWLFVL